MKNFKNIYFQYIVNFFLIIFLGIFQLSVISSLPFPFYRINLLLVFIIFILSMNGIEAALTSSILLGLILDFYSFPSTGANIFSFIISLAAINFLFKNFFTNRSLYSFFALSTIIYLLYEFNIIVLNYFFLFFGQKGLSLIFDQNFFIQRIYGLFLNWLVVSIIFYIYNFVSQRFKPFLLNR